MFPAHARHGTTRISRNAMMIVLTAILLLSAMEAKTPAANASLLAGQSAAGQQKAVEVENLGRPEISSPPLAPVRSAISLSPAVLMVRCNYNQSYTQRLTINNQTPLDFTFEMVAQDIIVRDGKRVFVVAGETPGSIAATAVFSQKQIFVKAGESGTVGVTFTIPPGTTLRGAIATFRGLNKVPVKGPVTMTASLGTLFTFSVTDNAHVTALPIEVTAQSATSNLRVSETLTNTGSEPLIAHGTAAVLNEAGKLIGKAPFEDQRLLPGEQLPFDVTYPAELQSGSYRVLTSFQYEKKVLTTSANFVVQ